MENELNRLLEVANTTIPDLVESYNVATREYNEMLEKFEQQELKLAEYEDVIAKLTHLTEKQAESLADLNAKHKSVIQLSNSRIGELDHKLTDAKTEIKELNKLNPNKLKKTVAEQKIKLAERLKGMEAEKGKVRNLKRELESVRNKLNLQKIGFWRNAEERLIENLTNEDLTLKELQVAASMKHMVWWQHECGLKLLFGFDKASKTVYCCDVINPETGKMQQPTAQALKQMELYFKDKL